MTGFPYDPQNHRKTWRAQRAIERKEYLDLDTSEIRALSQTLDEAHAHVVELLKYIETGPRARDDAGVREARLWRDRVDAAAVHLSVFSADDTGVSS